MKVYEDNGEGQFISPDAKFTGLNMSIIPEAVHKALEFVPTELLGLSEWELMPKLEKRNFRPSPVMNACRVQFWKEYFKTLERGAGKSMILTRIFSGVCAPSYFYMYLLRDRSFVAYMLTPPGEYTAIMEEGLNYGIKKLRDMLEFPLYDDKGHPNTKVADTILKIVAFLDTRLHGQAIQRIEQKVEAKNLNLNVDHESNLSPEELDSRIKQLQAKLGSDLPKALEMKHDKPLEHALIAEINLEDLTPVK
jgi:hypothetical protein